MQLQGRNFFDSPDLSPSVLRPCTIALKIADKWGKLRLQIDERKVSSSFNINHRIGSETPYLRTMKPQLCSWKIASIDCFMYIY